MIVRITSSLTRHVNLCAAFFCRFDSISWDLFVFTGKSVYAYMHEVDGMIIREQLEACQVHFHNPCPFSHIEKHSIFFSSLIIGRDFILNALFHGEANYADVPSPLHRRMVSSICKGERITDL